MEDKIKYICTLIDENYDWTSIYFAYYINSHEFIIKEIWKSYWDKKDFSVAQNIYVDDIGTPEVSLEIGDSECGGCGITNYGTILTDFNLVKESMPLWLVKHYSEFNDMRIVNDIVYLSAYKQNNIC